MGSKIRKEELTCRPTAARPQSCNPSSATLSPPMFFKRFHQIWSLGVSWLDHAHALFFFNPTLPKINETAMHLYGIRTCCSRWPASPGFFAFEDEMGKACWTRRNLDTWLGHSLGGEKLPK